MDRNNMIQQLENDTVRLENQYKTLKQEYDLKETE